MPDDDDPIAGINRRIDALVDAFAKFQKADSASEKKTATAEVESAEEALEKYARAQGISKQEAEQAINDLKRRAQKDQIRELLHELLEEDSAEEERKEKERLEAETAEQESKKDPEPDAVPTGGNHWTERKI